MQRKKMMESRSDNYGFTYGTSVEDAPTAYQAMNDAGLNWDVMCAPVRASVPVDADTIASVEIPNRFATVRMDTTTPLDVVSNRYQPIQNMEIADLIYEVADREDVKVVSAGCLNGGRRCFIQAYVNTMGLNHGDDPVHQYALFSWGHDGKTSLKTSGTSRRPACMNEMGGMMRDRSVSISHRGNVSNAVNMIRAHLGDVKAAADLFNEQAEKAISTEWNRQEMVEHFTRVYTSVKGKMPAKKNERAFKAAESTIGSWIDHAETHRFQEGCRGTAWAAHNAVTHWATHEGQVRRVEGATTTDARLGSVLFGRANEFIQTSLKSMVKTMS